MKKLLLCTVLVPLALMARESGSPPNKADSGAQVRDYSAVIKPCMRKADQTQLMFLQMRAAVIAAEIGGLCASGRRTQARSLAVTRAKQLERDPLVQEIRECAGLKDELIVWSELANPSSAANDICEVDLKSLPVFGN